MFTLFMCLGVTYVILFNYCRGSHIAKVKLKKSCHKLQIGLLISLSSSTFSELSSPVFSISSSIMIDNSALSINKSLFINSKYFRYAKTCPVWLTVVPMDNSFLHQIPAFHKAFLYRHRRHIAAGH